MFVDPSIVFLASTALGNELRCAIGDVVFSELVNDLSETKGAAEGVETWRSHHIEPAGRMRRDVGRYREQLDLTDLQARFHSVASGSQQFRAYIDELAHLPRAVHLEAMASGGALIANEDRTAELWRYDDRLACYDMESGGFARALDAGRLALFATPAPRSRGSAC